jgi:hypothetical protein
MIDDPMNESLSPKNDDIVEIPAESMVLRLDVPDGIELILIVNGVRVELDG